MVKKNVIFTLECTVHRDNYAEVAMPLPLSFTS